VKLIHPMHVKASAISRIIRLEVMVLSALDQLSFLEAPYVSA
jgi:hypothetical protein